MHTNPHTRTGRRSRRVTAVAVLAGFAVLTAACGHHGKKADPVTPTTQPTVVTTPPTVATTPPTTALGQNGFTPATYVLHLDTVTIRNTRSRHTDSDKVAINGYVNGTPITPVNKDLGDLNNGTFPIGLTVSFKVTRPEQRVSLNYLIDNLGHANSADIDKQMNAVGAKIAQAGATAAASAAGIAIGTGVGSAVVPFIGPIVGAALGWVTGELVGILTANCDGPVAAANITVSGQQLWDRTSAGTWTDRPHHPGVDSAAGCGSNSDYDTAWSIERVS